MVLAMEAGPPEPPNGLAKLLGRNCNGTVVVTQAPGNEAELQLYRVLQRASLLAYYDTLLEMGGDDVQQLCDAGEEEFLEIMALVGMASKPLHVRRLQKALQEWVTNPAGFRLPLPPAGAPAPPPAPSPRPPASPEPEAGAPPTPTSGGSARSCSGGSGCGSAPGSPGSPAPALGVAAVRRLAAAAARLARRLPPLEPRAHNAKKRACRELEALLAMPDSDPRRMDEIRRLAAIYGRFDCKRKPEKPLTLHEVSVNEAAAQMCRAVPALLTRRDELFPLARQLVRLAGMHYSKGHAQIGSACGPRETARETSEAREAADARDAGDEAGPKRARLEAGAPQEGSGGAEALEGAGGEAGGERLEAMRYASPALWARAESDDGDSRFSFSTCSSPSLQEQEEARAEAEGGRDALVRVVAASGDHIIAVANPALTLALTRGLLPKRECPSPLDG